MLNVSSSIGIDTGKNNMQFKLRSHKFQQIPIIDKTKSTDDLGLSKIEEIFFIIIFLVK